MKNTNRFKDNNFNKNESPLSILKGHKNVVFDLIELLNRNKMASCSKDRTIIIWNESFKQIKTLRGHTDCVNVLNYYKTKYLLSASNDRTLRIWDASTFQIIKALSGNQDSILSLTSFKSYIAYGTNDSQIKLYGDFYTNKNTLYNYIQATKLVIIPSTKIIISSSSQYLQAWNSTSYGYITNWKAHTGWIYTLVILQSP